MAPKARKGPDAHAKDTPPGTIAVGNDGNKWVVTKTEKGVKRWTAEKKGPNPTKGPPRRGASLLPKGPKKGKVSVVPKKGSTEYLTHDNGGRSFLVRYNKTDFTVFDPDDKELDALYESVERDGMLTQLWNLATGKSKADADKHMQAVKAAFTVPAYSSKYRRVFVGKSDTIEISGKAGDGNSMLFELPGGRYVCVMQELFSFKPKSPILTYDSPVYGSDVPYPYAKTKDESYLMLGHIVVPHSDLKHKGQDPYDIAYVKDFEGRIQTRKKKIDAYAKGKGFDIDQIRRRRQ